MLSFLGFRKNGKHPQCKLRGNIVLTDGAPPLQVFYQGTTAENVTDRQTYSSILYPLLIQDLVAVAAA